MSVQPSLFGPDPVPVNPPSSPPTSTTTGDPLAAARLQGLIRELTLLNEEIPVIVEGRRDVAALRHLGLTGAILTLHCGQTVAAFGERIAHRFPAVILLLDWDRRGRQLHTQLTRQLDTDWEEYHYIRQELIALCQSAISSIEELPALMAVRTSSTRTAPPRNPPATGRRPSP